ncbi:MAG: bifunctional DNA-formamidopyrimidine glycosylase/DNA-(apurinic or apyrimidinic site) lyase [Acidimicrobiia bacterium]|nr:bifunctional DNA-formamidopyrimidine glycosylase/DNA-(apurinic or apyrimidinic site) lyase [Acidimicrobiia bacterium]
MPELPEVETVRRGLADRLTGRTLVRLDVHDPKLVSRSAIPPASLIGGRVTDVARRGKWILCRMQDLYLVLHMRMSGQLLFDTDTARPPRASLHFDDGTRLDFVDQRRFGELLVWEQLDVGLLDARLGPEADTIRVDDLRRCLASRRGRLKAALCNQAVLAGIGNMYADEILWRARLASDRPAGSLDSTESRRLARAIRRVLGEALAAGGTTTRDGLYVTSEGDPGRFTMHLDVYQRDGEPCPRCGTPVERVKQGGVSVYWCPGCQS